VTLEEVDETDLSEVVDQEDEIEEDTEVEDQEDEIEVEEHLEEKINHS
jgi:hypothetical protein